VSRRLAIDLCSSLWAFKLVMMPVTDDLLVSGYLILSQVLTTVGRLSRGSALFRVAASVAPISRRGFGALQVMVMTIS
jgi:hypothetical protein